MLQANGENRKWLARTAGGALLTAVFTELGKWGVEEVRKRISPKTAPAPKTPEKPT